MKAYIIAASGAVLLALPAAALAQTPADTPTGAYVGGGYALHDYGGPDVGAVQGRVGARLNDNMAVEGEVGAGIDSDKDTAGAVRSRHKLMREGAVYGVGLLPVSPNTDVFARVGYGASKLKSQFNSAGVTGSDKDTIKSWRIGAGAQHFFDGVNGVRADYTREEATKGDRDGDTWSVGYVRRF